MYETVYSGNSPTNDKGITVLTSIKDFAGKNDSLPETDISSITRYNNRFIQQSGESLEIAYFGPQSFNDASATTGSVGSVSTLDFSSSGNNYAEFIGTTPGFFGSRPFDAKVTWTIDNAGSGNVALVAQLDAVPAGSGLTTNTYGPNVSGVFATPGSGVTQSDTISFTSAAMDGLRSSSTFKFKLYRDTDASSDTYTNDINIISVSLKESSNID